MSGFYSTAILPLEDSQIYSDCLAAIVIVTKQRILSCCCSADSKQEAFDLVLLLGDGLVTAIILLVIVEAELATVVTSANKIYTETSNKCPFK